MRSRFSRFLPAFAIAIGVALVAVTSAFKEKPKFKSDDTTYYFQFNGSNGQEDLPAQWSQIDESTYDLSSCSNDFRGCMLATTSVTSDGTNLHPSQVYVTGSGTNKSPVIEGSVTDVKNRDGSY